MIVASTFAKLKEIFSKLPQDNLWRLSCQRNKQVVHRVCYRHFLFFFFISDLNSVYLKACMLLLPAALWFHPYRPRMLGSYPGLQLHPCMMDGASEWAYFVFMIKSINLQNECLTLNHHANNQSQMRKSFYLSFSHVSSPKFSITIDFKHLLINPYCHR